jgi:hypothetical protein
MVFSLVHDRQTDTAGGFGEGIALLRYHYRVNNPPHPFPTTSHNVFSPKTIDFG